jgi:hypothetical protein
VRGFAIARGDEAQRRVDAAAAVEALDPGEDDTAGRALIDEAENYAGLLSRGARKLRWIVIPRDRYSGSFIQAGMLRSAWSAHQTSM